MRHGTGSDRIGGWRWLPAALFTLFVSCLVIGGATPAHAIPDGDENLGAWSELAPWPLVSIHASVLDDGRVLTYGGQPGDPLIDIWDPGLGFGSDAHLTFDNTLATNIFCSFALDDPLSSRKLLVGGETAGPRSPSFVAQLANDTLAEFPAMNNPRWYPTVTTLWDGRLLVQGGTPGNFDDRDDPTTVAEVYSPDDGWQNLEGTRNAGVWDTENYGWWYPKSHVTPAGKIWNLAWDQMYYLDPDSGGSVAPIGTFPTGNRGGSSASVMFDTGLVLQVGGGERGSDDQRFDGSRLATVIDLNYDPPVITPAASMTYGRHWADAVVLPDGRVLVSGGSLENNSLSGAAFHPEIWDPATDTWTVLAPNSTPRLYHSTAVLLADGTVFTGGGGKSGPVDNFNAEIFYPPYLYDADGREVFRPWIESAPAEIGYGEDFVVAAGGGPIGRVTLLRQANATHSMNTQVFNELEFTQVGDQLTVSAPDYATVATPGEYLLFLLDDDGVPSKANIVRLTGTGLEPPPPLDPGSATVTGRVDRVGSGPVAGVTVDLFEANADGSRGSWVDDAVTASDGGYRFEVGPGCWVATLIAPAGQTFVDGSRWFQAGGCVEAGQQLEVDATLAGSAETANVAGSVVRAGGGSVAGVTVDLFEASADGSRGTWVGDAVTDADGYSFVVDPGCWVVTFIAPAGETFTNGSPWFQSGGCVGAGETLSVDATLAGAGGTATVAGSVARAGGGPVAGVTVDLFEAAADGSRGRFVEAGVTDPDGTVAFTTEPGCWVLTFIAPAGEVFVTGRPYHQAGGCVAAGQTLALEATLASP